MDFRRSRLAAIACLALASTLCCFGGASAQPYPARPVKIVTGGAGTFHDIVARLLAAQLSRRWGQAVVVENQPAAGLTIGTGMVAHAAPDGYTLVLSDRSALAVAPWLFENLSYDVQADLAPITLVAVAPSVLVTTPEFPARDLRELVAYVKERPGRIHYGTAGPATASHVSGALLNHVAGLQLVMVPYKGGAPVIVALLAKEVEMSSGLIPAVLPQIRAGRLKALAVTSTRRFAGAPDIPTSSEAGLPEFVSSLWVGLLAPARTPAAIVAQLNRDVTEALAMPELRNAIAVQGAEPAPGSREEFGKFIRSESASMRQLVEVTGMRKADP